MVTELFQLLREHISFTCANVSDEINIFNVELYNKHSDKISVLIFKLLLLDAEIEEFTNRLRKIERRKHENTARDV